MKIEESVITDGCKAFCKMGTTAAAIVSKHGGFLYSDGLKVVVDSELGNPFQPGGFGICRIVPSAPKPCVPAVLKWSGSCNRFAVNNSCRPLTDRCKGVCACGGTECISFI